MDINNFISYKCIIGIDPGVNGAISVLTPDIYVVHDTPVFTTFIQKRRKGKVIKSIKKNVNIEETVNLIKQIRNRYSEVNTQIVAWIEKVHSMPDQGVVSMFSLGDAYGILKGIICALDIQLNYVTPQMWKKTLLNGMPKGKKSSVIKAIQLFPNAILTTKRNKELDGRAEALLIAEYGRRNS